MEAKTKALLLSRSNLLSSRLFLGRLGGYHPRPMTESKHPIVRLLNTPGAAHVVPRLPAVVLHRLIEHCGLEACVDLVALTTPGQLRTLLDIDLWRAGAPGTDERFDAGRFGDWLESLMQSGPEAAAAVVAKMDLDLLVGGLSDHISVFDCAA